MTPVNLRDNREQAKARLAIVSAIPTGLKYSNILLALADVLSTFIRASEQATPTKDPATRDFATEILEEYHAERRRAEKAEKILLHIVQALQKSKEGNVLALQGSQRAVIDGVSYLLLHEQMTDLLLAEAAPILEGKE